MFHNIGSGIEQFASMMEESLVENGFEVVYGGFVPLNVLDFTSYLAAVEESGAEILTTFMVGSMAIPLVLEWYDRQSPFVLWGSLGDIAMSDAWDITGGKCELLILGVFHGFFGIFNQVMQ